MISQDIRTLYVDSNWCNVDSDGSFRLDMFDTIEVKEGNVAFVDDITIQGSMPHVSTANNKLYVIEKTPYQWDFTGSCLLYTSPSPRDATLSRMPSSA